MIEAINNRSFKKYFKNVPLEEVIEALETAREKPQGFEETYLEAGSFLPEIKLATRWILENSNCKPGDLVKTVVDKAKTTLKFYKDHNQDCDEVIARWNTGK